ncbi:Ti-type conjugative transfer relaxase TraA [Rickettsia endosymbiont of Cardiosporidium cionae]|uniref:Ti-type conjugative transfer relaxase TraA n=1 Tax=Rickettsia endosymbiont of Cardiosporidium cionae TaxID=2777155 RepID=UPI00226BC871|nr:Ti-type conjugative transfer relaxase TraA [Rickettsia endosymbiont of Cardiosporidium cionae]KAF8818038.1 conjugal transfer protein TraA [Rickettsia endosymbiont of Cardiosporidium cionae]
MAICHFSYQMITRSKGHSAVGKAAYRSAEKLHDQRIDKTFDYRNKSDLLYKEVLLCKNVHIRLSDREVLWNKVEAVEKRKDSQLAREIEVSLPRELSDEQNIKLVKDYVRNQFVSLGMIADICIHKGHGKDQPHAHIMLTTREVSEEGFGKKVVEWDKQPVLYKWREEWANYTNKHLAKAGLDIRIDHRSNKERGIDLEPQNKIGPNGGRERYSEKVKEHEDIARRNGEKIHNDPGIAIDALTKYKSTFDYHELAKFIHRHTVDYDQFARVCYRVLSSPELKYLGEDDKGLGRYSSKSMVELEYRMVRQAQELDNSAGHQVDLERRENIAGKYGLDKSQRESFRHITGDRDIACVVGIAGSGKSYTLGAAREAWEASGYKVVGMTLSGIAAENLEGGSGIKSYTVANRIINWENDREKLSKNNIVVVDEAGMLGSRDIARIMDEATAAQAKVVMVGDPEQLQSIEAGAAFRGVIERVGFSEMNETRRQREGWQQEATKSLALGEIGDVIRAYSRKGMVHAFDSSDALKEKMVHDWHECMQEEKSSIMLAYTRKEVRDLNERAREVRKSYGEIGAGASYDTERGKRDFAIGDRIYFLKNDKELGVKNGTLATILRISQNRFTVNLDKGGAVKFDIWDYKDIDHGYAATIHKSQGMTVDKSFLLASKYLDKHAAYVGMSRHRESVAVYWSRDRFDGIRELVNSLSRENRKDLTLDFVKSDYKDTAGIFGQNKGFEIDKAGIKDLEVGIDKKELMRAHYTNEMEYFAKNIVQELGSVSFETEVENEKKFDYLGRMEINGKESAILGYADLLHYAVSNVKLEASVKEGDEIRVTKSIDNLGNIRTVLVPELKYDWKSSNYERETAGQYIKSIARGLQSRENYRIDKKVSTKDIYRALYHRLPSILPEFGFIRRGNSYVSTTGQKVDGSCGRKGKVYVYENNPGLLVDYTRESKSIWDYVSEIKGTSDKKDVFEYLAVASGIKSYFNDKLSILKDRQILDKSQNTKELGKSEPKIIEQKISSDIWQKLHNHCLDKMEIKNNQVERYLKEERRLSTKGIKDMGIGYLPSKAELVKSLVEQGVSKEKIDDLLRSLGCIGNYGHKMIMSYSDKSGNIIGIVARDIKYKEDSKFPKYVYSKGLARSSTMLGIENIDAKKPVIIVEGIMDSLRAKSAGLKNVVAIGGTGMNIRQVGLIKELGTREVKLCLDNDEAGKTAFRHIASMIYENNNDIKVSEIKFPKGVKDLDQLIKENGVSAAENVISSAKDINQYELQEAKELDVLEKFVKEKGGYEYEVKR